MSQKNNHNGNGFGRRKRDYFFYGVLKSFDLMGVHQRTVIYKPSYKSYGRAIKSDWQAVGRYMQNALNQYEASKDE